MARIRCRRTLGPVRNSAPYGFCTHGVAAVMGRGLRKRWTPTHQRLEHEQLVVAVVRHRRRDDHTSPAVEGHAARRMVIGGDDLEAVIPQRRVDLLPPGQVLPASSPGRPREQQHLAPAEVREANEVAAAVPKDEIRGEGRHGGCHPSVHPGWRPFANLEA